MPNVNSFVIPLPEETFSAPPVYRTGGFAASRTPTYPVLDIVERPILGWRVAKRDTGRPLHQTPGKRKVNFRTYT